MTTPLFNCRMDEDLQDAVEEAAEKEGLKKSAWGREVMAACAYGGVTLEDLAALVEAKGVTGKTVHPERHLALQGQVGRQTDKQARCVHPLPARKRMAFSVICGVCGVTVKRT